MAFVQGLELSGAPPGWPSPGPSTPFVATMGRPPVGGQGDITLYVAARPVTPSRHAAVNGEGGRQRGDASGRPKALRSHLGYSQSKPRRA